MVHLPSSDGQLAVVREGAIERRVRSHHNWGARFGRRRDQISLRTEPTSVHQLEDLARRTVELMEKHAPASNNNFSLAMDLLRQQYNLNFIILCKECSEPHSHGHDEIVAPER